MAKARRALGPYRVIALVFLGVILLGTVLLLLPFASRSGRSCGLLTALFTSTSATCVTGLVLADTWTQWSGFGQIVILGLIEIGGLGFMSAASLVIFALRRRVSFRQRMVMAQSIGVEYIGDIIKLQRGMLVGCLSVQGMGALILTLRFWADFPFLRALNLGAFHSVSAFCNAGFDLMGFPGSGGVSMSRYHTDPTVALTLCALITAGGVGFLVWQELFTERRPKKWSVYTKLVLITSGVLLIGGTALICAAEWGNPATLGDLSPGQKLLAGLFQSATCRTAGFAGVDQSSLTETGKGISMFLMLIGGSSGSTAGGLKTVTFVVILLFLWNRARGRHTVNVFRRTIPVRQVLNALTVFGIMVGAAFFGGLFLTATSGVTFTDALYESVSALATVGVSAGITPDLALAGKIMLMIFMYFGRVGVLTISLGFLAGSPGEEDFRYAETNLLIG